MTRSVARHPLLVVLVASLTAGCSPSRTVLQAGTPATPVGAHLASAREVLTVEEMQLARVTTVVEAVRLLRPEYLGAASVPSVAGAVQAPAVYVDETHVGGPDELRTIPLDAVEQIRFLRPSRAHDRWGAYCPCAGGVILVQIRRRR